MKTFTLAGDRYTAIASPRGIVFRKAADFDTRLPMDAEQRGSIGADLNALLCSLMDLRLSLQLAHWNVKGINFQQLHELFDKLQKSLLPHIDLVAENVATLGMVVVGTADDIGDRTILMPYSNGSDQYAILDELADRYAYLIRHMMDLVEELLTDGIQGIADVLIGIHMDLERNGLYFLESHIPSANLQKAARRSMLEEGATKERNGVTYRLNKNRRWERSDRGSKPARGKRPKPPGGVVPVIPMDGAKAKGKPRAMCFDSRPPGGGAQAVQQGKLNAKAQRAAAKVTPKVSPVDKPAKAKKADVKPKGKKTTSASLSDDAFVDLALNAAKATQGGRLGDSKVFISKVWETLQQQHPDLNLSLDDFKKRLVRANRQRKLDLSRADMAYALDANDVSTSQIKDDNSEYHFIRQAFEPEQKPASTGKVKPKGKKATVKPKAEKTQPQAKAIASYGEFKNEVARIYDKLNTEENLGNMVPIYRIRRELGDRVSRAQFREWLLDVQAEDKIQMMGGVTEGSTDDQRADGIMMPGGRIRFYVKKLKDFDGNDETDSSKARRKPKSSTPLQPKPKTTPIKSYDDFKSEVASVYDRLNKDYNLGDLVPIHRIRRELGNRVSREQFDKWLIDVQSDDHVQLMGGALPNATQADKDDALQIMGNLRFYVKKL
jgi:DNA-binding ferritin-like protein